MPIPSTPLPHRLALLQPRLDAFLAVLAEIGIRPRSSRSAVATGMSMPRHAVAFMRRTDSGAFSAILFAIARLSGRTWLARHHPVEQAIAVAPARR